MELGFAISVFDIDGGTTAIAGELARVGAAAEEAGATWLAVMDHYFQIEPTGLPAEANMLEGYTTLGYLAAHTSTVTLGLLVIGVTYRHPWPMCDQNLLFCKRTACSRYAATIAFAQRSSACRGLLSGAELACA